MHPTPHPGPADGSSSSLRATATASSPLSLPAASQPGSRSRSNSNSNSNNTSPGQTRRRQRVDSSSSLHGTGTTKRRRSSPPGNSNSNNNNTMTANAYGKMPAVVDLTGPSSSWPATRRITSQDLAPQADAERERLRREAAASVASAVQAGGGGMGRRAAASSFQPQLGARKLVVKNLRTVAAGAASTSTAAAAAADTADTRAREVQQYYERTWAEMEAALQSLFAGQTPQQPLERVYRGVENLCLHGQAGLLYRKLRGLCKTHLNTVVRERLLADMRTRSDVEALRLVYYQWQVWIRQSTMIRSTFSYLDRAYLANERSLPQLNDMLITRFRRMVFEGGQKPKDAASTAASTATVTATETDPLTPGKQVVAGMCALVDQDRRGDAAFDGHLLREAVSMLHVCNVYGRYFEPAFLRESEAYLREVAQERDAGADLQRYIQGCEALLRREDTRCNAFNLDSSTKKALLAVAQRLLVTDKAPALLEAASVARLLDAHDVAAVRALYELLRLSGLHRDLRAPWEAYIVQRGLAIATDAARGDEMVVRLLLLRRQLDVMVRDALGHDKHMQAGLRQAFGRFVNDPRVSVAWGGLAPSKVGEMVAKHLDMLLRGGLKTLPPALLADKKDRATAERTGQASAGDEDAELDRQLDAGLELFRFVEGKDVFEAFYKKALARRLLMGRSASEDAERNMLSKLKVECGANMTHNLEQMFRDQELSRDEMVAYKQWLGRHRDVEEGEDDDDNEAKVDLQVSVLSAAAWPTYREVALNVPAEVVAAVDRFDRYYKNKHTGRQLTWMHTLGHSVVKARFARGSKELLVSALQAAVLMLFNQAEVEGDGVLSYSQIGAATALEDGDLDRTLQSLACGKVRVLTKHPRGRDVAPTDTFTVNRGFSDPKMRIKINQIQLRETRAETRATYARVAADRQFETQAAIVRIMKSRKQLGHAQLVAEVIGQTKSRGAMDPAEIKQNIEKLIEKDYIEREDDKYVYLA